MKLLTRTVTTTSTAHSPSQVTTRIIKEITRTISDTTLTAMNPSEMTAETLQVLTTTPTPPTTTTTSTDPAEVLQSFLVPWSTSPCEQEERYRSYGFVRTVSSIFPPTLLDDFVSGALKANLIASFQQPHSTAPGVSITAGARALAKHFVRITKDLKTPGVRGGSDAIDHPFWNRPTGSEATKNARALAHLVALLDLFETRDPNVCWKNIHNIQPNNTTIIEIRETEKWYGMRWTVLFEDGNVDGRYSLEFRGFLEPL